VQRNAAHPCTLIFFNDVLLVRGVGSGDHDDRDAVFYTAETLVFRVRGIPGFRHVISIRKVEDKLAQIVMCLASEE
jgi:hypothetical protein